MQRAIAYIRVSDQRQVDDGGSLSTQHKLVLAHAASRGYSLAKVFREEGESAKTDQRPKLKELIEFCQNNTGKVDVLVVPKIDRLARNVLDYGNLKTGFQKLGVTVESVGERLEDNPVGRFTESILASVAQFDNEIRAERSKGGMVEAVTQGRFVWKAPIGYRNVRFNGKGTIEPDPHSAPIVQEAFMLLAQGQVSVARVRQLLLSSGIEISRPGLYRLVSNPVYVGRIHAFGRMYDGKAPFVPLISEEIFYKARNAMKKTQAPDPETDLAEDFPLRGTVRCICGRTLTGNWSKGKTKTYPYYRCLSCHSANYRAELVDGAFAEELTHYKPVDGIWDHLADALRAKARQFELNNQGQRHSALAKIHELKAIQKSIVLKMATGVIPDSIGGEKLRELEADIAALSGEMPDDAAGPSTEELLVYGKWFLNNLHELWLKSGLKTKKALLAFLFPNGVVYLPERAVRTPGNAVLEQIRQLLSGDVSTLVDQPHQFYNSMTKWLEAAHRLGSSIEDSPVKKFRTHRRSARARSTARAKAI